MLYEALTTAPISSFTMAILKLSIFAIAVLSRQSWASVPENCKCVSVSIEKEITCYLPVSIGSGRQLLAFSFGVERSQRLFIWPTHRRPTSSYLMLSRAPVQQRHMRRGELEVGQVRLASRATCWNVPGVGRPDMSSSHSSSRVRKELHYWESTQICGQRDFTRACCSWHQVRWRE